MQLGENYSHAICITREIVNKFYFLAATIDKYDIFLDNLSEKAVNNLVFETAFNVLFGIASLVK